MMSYDAEINGGHFGLIVCTLGEKRSSSELDLS